MTNTLILFIDSFPFALLPETTFLKTIPERWSLEPGFGYSVNIHAEMFAGLLPDDVGYFGEWMYDPARAPGKPVRHLLPLLDAVFRPYLFNRGLQYLYLRAIRYRPGHAMPNIRLRDLDKFAMEGDHLLDDPAAYPHPSLFTEFLELKALPVPKLPLGERDPQVYAQAMNAIPQHDSLLASFVDLDGFGHVHGIDGDAYWAHIRRLEMWVAALSERFLDHHPHGHVIVVSDHGMVNVDRGLDLDIEVHFGPSGGRRYVYFSDANLLRVWVFDEKLKPSIRDYLQGFAGGHILTPETRQTYGLTSPRFGDFIYVLDEGLAFEPSTFARHKPKGMHGYHPTAPGQQAILLHTGPQWRGTPPARMRDLYAMLRCALEGTW